MASDKFYHTMFKTDFLHVFWLFFFNVTLSYGQLVQTNTETLTAETLTEKTLTEKTLTAEPLTVEQWLKNMQVASVQESYLGTFVLTRGDTSSTMNVVHRFQNGVEQERLKQLDGEMGEIIRNGTEVMCIFPNNRVVQVEQTEFSNKVIQAFSNFLPGDSQYNLSLAGLDRMIDRPSMEVEINAKDADRYSYRLWLDQETGLLLKSSLHDSNGHDLERFQFTDISFPDKIEDQQLKSMNEGSLTTHELIPSNNKDARWPSNLSWKIDWNPLGYRQVKSDGYTGNNVMIYTDGLATYSVFIEKVEDNDILPEGATQVGATVAYSHQQKFNADKYNVTVIGEIPAITAMKIAESVQPFMMNLSMTKQSDIKK